MEPSRRRNSLNYFKKHIEKKMTPKKQEVVNFIKNQPGYELSDWIRIKTLVYNTYRKK